MTNDDLHTWARTALRAMLKRCVKALAADLERLASLHSEGAK